MKSKMKLSVKKVNGWKVVNIVTKSSILDFVVELDTPLILSNYNFNKNKLFNCF